MGSVVALDAFRKHSRVGRNGPPPRPAITGADVWGRDYRETEAVVYGLLTARGLAAHHAGAYDADFDQLCLNALEAAYRVADQGVARLRAAILPLKQRILDALTEENKRDLSWALVLLDLIEKSPSR